jgi:hypothetical protein
MLREDRAGSISKGVLLFEGSEILLNRPKLPNDNLFLCSVLSISLKFGL